MQESTGCCLAFTDSAAHSPGMSSTQVHPFDYNDRRSTLEKDKVSEKLRPHEKCSVYPTGIPTFKNGSKEIGKLPSRCVDNPISGEDAQ